MDATNLDFVSAHDLWGYQATVRHPISGWSGYVNMSVGFHLQFHISSQVKGNPLYNVILTWNSYTARSLILNGFSSKWKVAPSIA
jgi:hypothetical protein